MLASNTRRLSFGRILHSRFACVVQEMGVQMKLKFEMTNKYLCGAPMRYEWHENGWDYVMYHGLTSAWWQEMFDDLRKRCCSS